MSCKYQKEINEIKRDYTISQVVLVIIMLVSVIVAIKIISITGITTSAIVMMLGCVNVGFMVIWIQILKEQLIKKYTELGQRRKRIFDVERV